MPLEHKNFNVIAEDFCIRVFVICAVTARQAEAPNSSQTRTGQVKREKCFLAKSKTSFVRESHACV